MGLGEAFITVKADTSPFTADIEKLKREVALQKATLAVTAATVASGAVPRGSTTDTTVSDAERTARQLSALQAQMLRDDLANQQVEVEQQRAAEVIRVAEAKAANDAIKAINQETTDRLKVDLAAQVAAVKAAADAEVAARKAAADAQRALSAQNSAGIEELRIKYRDLETAERAAYAEQDSRVRALTVAQRDLEKAADDAYRAVIKGSGDADKEADTLGKTIASVSTRLSQLGFTGQTRLITLGLAFGAPVAVLGAFALAAGAAGTAVTVFGVKAADAARSATLQFQSLGLSSKEAAAEFAALQDLSDKGLQIANLDLDARTLLQIGVNAKDANAILSALADTFAHAGDVGKQLQTDIDTTAKAIATLSANSRITASNFDNAVRSLGLPVTAKATFVEIEKDLGLTNKQLDDLIAKGKLTGNIVATAALRAASAGAGGALATAVSQSPTQALEALRSSAQTTLAGLFSGPGGNTSIAGFINQLSTQIDQAIKTIGPGVLKTIQDVLPTLISAIGPFAKGMEASFQVLIPILKSIGPIISTLSEDVIGFFSQANTKGSATQQVLHDFRDVFQEIGAFASAAVPAIEAVGGGVEIVANALSAAKPEIDAIANALKLVVGLPVSQWAIAVGTAIGILSLAVGGVSTLIAKLGADSAKTAAELATLVAAEEAAAAGATALAVAEGRAAVATEALGAASLTAGGEAGAAGLLGKFNGLLGAAGKYIPLAGLAVGAGYELGKGLTNLAYGMGIFGSSTDKASASLVHLTAQEKQLAPVLQSVGDALRNSGVDAQESVRILDAFRANVANGESQVAAFGDALISVQHELGGLTAEQAVSQLRALGATNDIIIQVLEAMGATADAAYAAVNSADFSAIDGQLASVANQAYAAAQGISVLMAAAQAASDAAFHATGQQGPTPLSGPGVVNNGAINGLKINVPSLPTFSGGGGGGGSGAASSAKQAAKTLADATAAFKTSLSDFTKAIGSAQTVDQVTSAFDSLRSAIDAEDKALGKAEPKGLAAFVTKTQAQINKLARQNEQISEEIALAKPVAQAIATSGNVTQLPPGQQTIVGVVNGLRNAINNASRFKTDIEKLKALGLNNETLTELLQAGPAQGLQAADAILNASSSITTINGLQTKLTGLANSIGDTAGPIMEANGEALAKGLLTGLQSQQAAIEKQMADMGKAAADAFRKAMGIKSPSTVMMDAGANVALGVVEGIRAQIPAARRASAELSQNITFGPGSVQVNGVADPWAAQRTGILTGQGITGVLSANRQAVALGSL